MRYRAHRQDRNETQHDSKRALALFSPRHNAVTIVGAQRFGMCAVDANLHTAIQSVLIRRRLAARARARATVRAFN